MITIKEIADLANVSRTTVSRVLNNSGYVSEKARQSVLKVIEETGYIPSAHAKALRTKRSRVIGVILPKISTETSSRVVNGMNEVLAGSGYQILLANTNLDKEKEIEYLKLLQSRQVDGVVLLGTNTEKKLQKEMRELKIPVIVVGQELAGIPSIVFDDYGAARELAGLFVEKGYRSIAFIGVDEADRAVGLMRKKGFLSLLNEHGISIKESWMQTGDFSIESGYEAMRKILKNSNETPEAVFAVTDRMAVGALRLMKEKGLKVPEDIAIAGIGASEISRYIEPSLTTVEYQNEKAGIEAAQWMLKLVENEKISEKLRKLDYRLIVRDSL